MSREEFLRLLRTAVGPFEVDGQTVRRAERDRCWTIRVVPLADCQLGSVAVPRLRVEIALEASSEAEAEAFMDHFHRAFLRTGG